MPEPAWDWAPSRRDGQLAPGFSRTPGNMGSMFVYPEGTAPQDFIQQQIASGAIPSGPEVIPDAMDETALYQGTVPEAKEGSMPWESDPAPWAVPSAEPQAIMPQYAPQAISALQVTQDIALEGHAIRAARAAKIASDNAVRAAAAGAPKIAATNAATAQAAANVAAGVSRSANSQRAAAAAQHHATKAAAAAQIAAKGAAAKSGVGDWVELSGVGDWVELSGMEFLDTPVAGGVKVKHLFYGVGLATLGYFGYQAVKR